MADLVSSIGSATAVWGQPQQQDPQSQTTTTETQESTTSSSSGTSSDTSTTSTQPTTSETSSSTTSSAAPSGSTTTSSSTSTRSMAAEISRMPERLRDLIIQQRKMNPPAATAVRNFADQMASDRVAANDVKVEKTALIETTSQQIVEQASKALVAQANQTRDSVRALLEIA